MQCNVGLDQMLLTQLQMVQNAAAQLLVGVKKYKHITPLLSTQAKRKLLLSEMLALIVYYFNCGLILFFGSYCFIALTTVYVYVFYVVFCFVCLFLYAF